MSKKIRRKKYLNTNKYQKQIILLSFVPTLITCTVACVLLLTFYEDLINSILNGTAVTTVQFVNQWNALILLSLWIVFVIILGWAYVVSMNLVGAFERIIRELDEVIEGKRTEPITARPKDILANELLKRINVLIKNATQTPKTNDR